MSYWGATVIINLLSVVSYQVCIILWRRFVVSEYTVTRFYVLHFFNTFGLGYLGPRPFTFASRYWQVLFKLFSAKDLILSFFNAKGCFSMVFLFLFVFLVCVYSNSLRDAENYIHANPMVTPIHIKPEWYFLFAYAILRCIPDKTTRVLALAAS